MSRDDDYYGTKGAFRYAKPRVAKVGSPCEAVKADGNFCPRSSVRVVEGRVYCERHARIEDRR